jgi:hypothetical protein
MPKVALAESLVDWQTLIANASVHAADDVQLGEHLEQLRVILQRAQETEALRLRLEAERQTATRMLTDAKIQGKKMTSRIRSKLKAIYGTTSDQLIGFGIRPRPSARGEARPTIQVSKSSPSVAADE